MHSRAIISFIALSLFVMTGYCMAENVSFKSDVIPLLQKNCVSCHVSGDELGNLGLAPNLAYGFLVSRGSTESKLLLVSPGDPESSYLIHKLRGTHLDNGGKGSRMPMGLPALADNELTMITTWISQGADNN